MTMREGMSGLTWGQVCAIKCMLSALFTFLSSSNEPLQQIATKRHTKGIMQTDTRMERNDRKRFFFVSLS
jgi:hypothetical protein